MAWCNNAINQLVSSALLDVRFSEREGRDVLNVVFWFNIYEVYMVVEDSKDLLVLSIGDLTSI